MNALFRTLILLALLLTACVHPEHRQPVAPVGDRPIATAEEAIAVVLSDIRRQGGDPGRKECSATPMGDGWHVIAWHIWYPGNSGSSRFVPGGFTTYVVGREGVILKVVPGH